MTNIQSNQSNEKIMKVLRKMETALNRHGINNYQERIHRIHKVLLSIERHSNCNVSKFSIDNINDNNNITDNAQSFQNNTTQFIDSTKNFSNEEQEKIIVSGLCSPKKLLNIDLSLKNEKSEKEVVLWRNENGGEILFFKNFDENNSFKLELDELFKFIEDELKVQSLLSIQDSTQFSSNSDEDTKSIEEVNHQTDSENSDETSSENGDENNVEKFTNSKFKIPADIYMSVNNRNQTNINNIKVKKCPKPIKVMFGEKQFSTSKKGENLNKSKLDKKTSILLEKNNFKNIFFNIELRLRAYLKEAENKKIFETRTFESFLNEDKFKTPSSNITAKSQTPSIIKNFFEDKEVIEITKKRHSVAGEVLKARIEKLRDLEINKKCLSNYQMNLNEMKCEWTKKNSRISDFSLDLSQNNNEESNKSEGNVADFTKYDGNKVKFSKRGSILIERSSNMHNFDTVQEEERILDISDRSLEDHEENLS